jgi:uncharacterized membrane protein
MIILVAALGSGLMSGVFFAFSTFVMRALDRLPFDRGMAAMQTINVAVLNPWFLGVFAGTGVLSAILVIGGLVSLGTPGALCLVAGGLLYLVGCVGVTMRCNVPLNEELAATSPESPDARRVWTDYVSRWTLWNHVRTVAPLVASALYMLALR